MVDEDAERGTGSGKKREKKGKKKRKIEKLPTRHGQDYLPRLVAW